MTKPPPFAITSGALSPASTTAPPDVINLTALALVLAVITELSRISPSAVMSISPVLLETKPPSVMTTAPPFDPALESALMLIAPSTETTLPNSPISTLRSALISIVDATPVVRTAPSIMVEVLDGAFSPSPSKTFPTAKTWVEPPSASTKTLST